MKMTLIKCTETWTKGKTGGCVVTNTNEGFSENTGHSGIDARKYYGGSLICESIYREKDIALISAAPDLLDACLTAKAIYESLGINENSRIGGDQYKKLLQAISKATTV